MLSSLQGAINHYDDLFMVLAPYLHEARYTSYGRHFTMPHLLHAVADRCGWLGLGGVGWGRKGGWVGWPGGPGAKVHLQ